MEQIQANPILKFNPNQLQNVRKAVGYDDVRRLVQDIEQLQDWIKKQNHFRIKEFDSDYIERWLIVNKGSIERTKQRFDRLCTCTNLMPEFLQNFDIKNEFYPVHKVTNNFVLPQPTKDNYRILISSLTGADDKDFSVIGFYRYLIVLGHYMLRNDYYLGYEWIGDLRLITTGVLSVMNPLTIYKALNLLIEAMAQRMKRVHFITGSKICDTALSIIKQGMSAKLRARVIVHTSVEGLYEYLLKEQLPKELGGNAKTMKEFNDQFFKELSKDDHIEKVKFMERVATDEAYRLPSKFNEDYSGMPGSFKTMCVD